MGPTPSRPAPVAGEQFGTATPTFNVGNLHPCAYIVTLEMQLQLTTGDGVPSDLFDQIAFCKTLTSRRRGGCSPPRLSLHAIVIGEGRPSTSLLQAR